MPPPPPPSPNRLQGLWSSHSELGCVSNTNWAGMSKTTATFLDEFTGLALFSSLLKILGFYGAYTQMENAGTTGIHLQSVAQLWVLQFWVLTWITIFCNLQPSKFLDSRGQERDENGYKRPLIATPQRLVSNRCAAWQLRYPENRTDSGVALSRMALPLTPPPPTPAAPLRSPSLITSSQGSPDW